MVNTINPSMIMLYLQGRGCKNYHFVGVCGGYVDNGDDEEDIVELKRYLNSKFRIKDLGALKYFPRVEIARSNSGFRLKGSIL